MWFKEKFFKYAAALLLVLVIIFFAGRIDFFLVPFKRFVAILFFPILISLLLYYLMRPLVRVVEKLKVPRTLAITIIFLVTILLIVLVSTYAGGLVGEQFGQLSKDLPGIYSNASNRIEEFLKSDAFTLINEQYAEKVQQQVANFSEWLIPFLSMSIFGVFSTLTNIVTVLVVVPFILFYLLRDDRYFANLLKGWLPGRYKKEIVCTLRDVDKTLSIYIIGQGIVALVIGIMMYIGYLFIGIKYPFILALFAAITAFIPLFGSVIGVLPALLVSLADNPFTALKILIIAVIVQQLEGNLISPQLMGKRLAIHPLTLILLFLVAGSLYGFVGMLIAVPTYAVLKVVIVNVVKIYRIYKADSFTQGKIL